MVRCSDGGIVSVIVANQEAQEYGLEEKTEGMLKTYTCYIEAKEGDEFQIRAGSLKTSITHRTYAKVYVDGQWTRKLGVCQDGSTWTADFKGYRVSTTAEEETYRAFTFGKMDIKNDDSVKKLAAATLNNVCSIRVETFAKKRIGHLNHTPAYPKSQALPTTSVYHEDSKPALWGISAKPGREFCLQRRRSLCYCTTTEDPSMLRHDVIFKYFSHEWLVAKGLKEGRLDDDEVIVDNRRTTRMASRRRARGNIDSWARNVRVKREGTAVTVKEEVVLRQTHMLDLTGEGDFIPASRRVGEVIVIEDDDDDDE